MHFEIEPMLWLLAYTSYLERIVRCESDYILAAGIVTTLILGNTCLFTGLFGSFLLIWFLPSLLIVRQIIAAKQSYATIRLLLLVLSA